MTFITSRAFGGETDIRDASCLRLLPHNYADRAPVERLIGHLWCCGPRAVAEFLDALTKENGIGAAIAGKLQEYHRLDPETLSALGCDRFAAAPLHVVGGQP